MYSELLTAPQQEMIFGLLRINLVFTFSISKDTELKQLINMFRFSLLMLASYFDPEKII